MLGKYGQKLGRGSQLQNVSGNTLWEGNKHITSYVS